MNKETFLYLDGHTEYHEVDDNAVYHHVTDDNRLNYRIDVNDATFEWHNNTWIAHVTRFVVKIIIFSVL